MIECAFFTSVEFYVMAAIAAAAVLGVCVRPASKGEAQTHLLAGVLCSMNPPQAIPAIHLQCHNDGSVTLTRGGLHGLTDEGAVSLAVTVAGFDVTIEERMVPTPSGNPVDAALFTLDFLGQEHYHVRYNSDATGLFAAFTLSNRPDMNISRELKH